MRRTYVNIGFFVAAFAFFLFAPHSSHAASALQGTISSVSQCYDTPGYALTVTGSTSRLIFRPAGATVLPTGFVPTVGASVFAAISESATCDIAPGPGITPVSGSLVTYLSSTSSVSPPTSPPKPASQPGGTSGTSGTNIPSQLPGLLGELFGRISGPGSGSSAGSGSSLSGGITSKIGGLFGGAFGGSIKTIVPCLEPPGFLITLGLPSPGFYVYLAGTTRYLTIPPIHPGQYIVGTTAGFMTCWDGPVLVGAGKLITPTHGTSL